MKKVFKVVLVVALVITVYFAYHIIYSYTQVKAAYDVYNKLTQNMDEIVEPYLVDGMVAVEELDSVLEEVSEYAEDLYAQGDITNYSYQQGDSCVYMEIDGWLGMVYDVPVKDFLSGDSDGISIVTMEPYASDFGVWANYVMSGTHGPDEAAELIESAYHSFSFSTDLEDSAVTVESVKQWPSHSIIIWMGHGGHSSRLDNPAFSGSYIAVRDDGTDPQTLFKYRKEIESGAIYVSSSGTLNLTPVFFEQYMPSNALEGSVVYISACYSAADSKLAQSILDNGAIAYLGNTTLTTQGYGFKMPYAFFEALTPPKDGGYIMSVTEALKYAKAKHGDSDWYANSQVGIAALYDFTLPEMIPLMGEVFDVSTDFKLSVYGGNKDLCDNYSVYITQARALNECYLSCGENVELDDVITHCMDYKTVTTANDVPISLTPGIYELALVDNTDIEKTQIITIQVLDETGSNTLSINTDFGSEMIDNQTEPKSSNSTSIYEIAESATGLHCEWAVGGDFDDDGSDEIYALLCTSSSDYSNGQLWHFTSTENRCVFYIEEAEFEMICDIVKTIPDWLAVEIIDSVDNIDEFISDLERKYF